MPYDKDTEDRALNRLMKDIQRHPDTHQPRTYGGVGFAFMLLSLLLALWLLLAVGCNTVAGIGHDLTDLADGTRNALGGDANGQHHAQPRQP